MTLTRAETELYNMDIYDTIKSDNILVHIDSFSLHFINYADPTILYTSRINDQTVWMCRLLSDLTLHISSRTSEKCSMICGPVRRDNPRALTSGLSIVLAHKSCSISNLYHTTQRRPCLLRDISCLRFVYLGMVVKMLSRHHLVAIYSLQAEVLLTKTNSDSTSS